MKRLFLFLLLLLPILTATACSNGEDGESFDNNQNSEQMEKCTIQLTIGGKSFTATLEDNVSAKALCRLLAEGDMKIEMEDYAQMEKVGSLGVNLPRDDQRISVGAGDLILYQGNQFVIYYDTNTWTFTRLGKIDKVSKEELLSALGSGGVTVTLSLN